VIQNPSHLSSLGGFCLNNSHCNYYHTSRLHMKGPYFNSFYASKMRAYRQKKKDKGVAMARDMSSQFPFEDLQRMAVGSRGVSPIGNRGHFLTLNCTNVDDGKFTVGLVYKNHQKILATGTPLCQNSKKYLSLLKLIESSITESTKIEHSTTFLRA
jgi:hypothetical protein